MKTLAVSLAALAQARTIARQAPLLPPPIVADWRNSQPPGARPLPPGQPMVGPAQKIPTSTGTGSRPLAAYLGSAAVHETTATSSLAPRVRVGLFMLIGLNVIYLLVMLLIPSTTSLGAFAAFITWGGHLWAPMILALAATVGLTTVALLSAGFTRVNRNHLIAVWVCIAASVVSTGLAVVSLALVGICLALIAAFIILIVGGMING